MRAFGILPQNVPGWLDTGIVLAATRAGEPGILNLEGIWDLAPARDALDKVSRYARRSFGLKLETDWPEAEELLSALPQNVDFIALTACHESDRLHKLVDRVRTSGRRCLLEVTSRQQARLGKSAGVDAFIAKGHEAGGRVGEETAFVLLQHLLAETDLPVWVQGGIGLNSAAACHAAGAAGVVLDSQLLLTPESNIPAAVRIALERLEGEETVALGADCGQQFRILKRVGMNAADRLQARAHELAKAEVQEQMHREWREILLRCISWSEPESAIWPLGQEAVLAGELARRFYNVAGIIRGIRESIARSLQVVSEQPPLRPGAPLAATHKTEYPIFQGPMTRVSDVAEFAGAVARNGALPFIALALLRGAQMRELLARTRSLLGERSWGVGILGFVPPELRAEQIEMIREFRPPCAIIAGGRPDQARGLESIGIPTYLHVPAPALLRMFLEDGARRFIFEGRECGGHVGPRSSFVLWEVMIATLLEAIRKGIPGSEIQVVFAGGIQDSLSAAMVSALAAPLVEQGVQIGVLMGTAYLFTKEAVESGAVVEGFQKAAIECQETVLLESGPGHATRCVASPFQDVFRASRRRLIEEGKTIEETKNALEELNLGRLRIATKGVARRPQTAADEARYEEISPERQWTEGVYMIGQVAALRKSVCGLRELHENVSAGSSELLRGLHEETAAPRASAGIKAPPPCDVAIIGMSSILPQAPNLAVFWKNLIARKDAIVEIPAARFDANLYYDQDRKASDKIYSKWGGFLDRVPFDPIRYGIPPNALAAIDPVQLFSLIAVEKALEDAAYDRREFDRERASVILGLSGGLGDLGIDYAVRSNLPQFLSGAPPEVYERLPQWTEDSFAGILLNVAAGRVANRFNLGGVNFGVDAACASSLAAVYLATRELSLGSSDTVIVGGVDTVQSPFGFLCFSKAQALSPTGRCRPFDESADGIAISEGVTMLVLKRLADAERDGDRVYAVIKGVAGSSDGRGRSMTAPRPEGQVLSLRRAYAQAGFDASQVGLIEAHGTGTVAGDETEIASLAEVFVSEGAAPQSCAIGSVKSMVGHTKAAAGVTGLMKAALALHYRVIPPTLHVERPNSKLREPNTPFYVNVEPRPWLCSPDQLRRAGVSSFGFGGTNFHAVLEEYAGDGRAGLDVPLTPDWPVELFLWEAPDTAELGSALAKLADRLRGSKPRLSQLAAAICKAAAQNRVAGVRLAILAGSLEELVERIGTARAHLSRGETRLLDARQKIYMAPSETPAPIAFLFPGQGSQYPGMLREAGLYLPELRMHWELADRALKSSYPSPLSRYVYPPSAFSDQERNSQMQAVTRTVVAQPALGVVSLALCRALERVGVRPAMVAGHSFGEYVALAAAGVFDAETLFRLAEARGRSMEESVLGADAGSMAAVAAGADQVRQALGDRDDVTIANLNAPQQTIISGTTSGVKDVSAILAAAGLSVRPIPVACAFHSALMQPVQQRFASHLSRVRFSAPQLDVYSNTLAQRYPEAPSAIAELLGEHLLKPVRFVEEILAMYDAGARIFVEVGPKNVLSGLARRILEGREATILSTDSSETGFGNLLQALAHLHVLGCRLKWDELFRGRAPSDVDIDTLCRPAAEPGWWLTGARAFAAARPYEMKPPIENPAAALPVVPVNGTPGAAQKVTPAIPAAPVTGADAVILQYQQMMAQFLESQSAVMKAYLQGGNVPGVPEATPVPVAVPAAIPLSAPVSREPAVQPPASSPAAPDLAAELIRIASARTGYPPEMLQLDASIEADLGIDSIKRVEILGALQRQLPAAQQAAVRGVMEKLTRARTFAEILSTIADRAPIEPESASGPVDVDVKGELIRIASERTGYPPDMLQLDASMEADLGIDSIKRVEILGALQRQLPEDRQAAVRGVMEKLTRARTLGEIVAHITQTFNGDLNGAPTPPANKPGDSLPTFRLALREISSQLTSPRFQAGRTCVITDDETGLAERLAASLTRAGEKVVLLRHGEEALPPSDSCVVADLTEPTSTESALETIRRLHGPIGAILHLLPLRADLQQPAQDLAAWRRSVRLVVRSLYLLVRASQSDLERRGAAGEALIAVVTGRGGSFGLDQPASAAGPPQFAVADFAKTLAQELSDVVCRVIDVDPTEPAAILKQKLLDELTSLDRTLQVGRPADRRLTLVAQAQPSEPVNGQIGRDWVIVLTGGARGITSQVARAIAARSQATLILAGASRLPERSESADTAGISDTSRLKAILLARLRSANPGVKAADVEAASQRLLRDREILKTIDDLKAAGSNVEYHALDVRDQAALSRFVGDVYSRHGRLDVFIHGAGIIEDRLIRDKTPESFDRVVHTKSDSAYVLTRLLRPEKLRRLVFMSSISAAFGNRGQADYAAANGILNGLAVCADSHWQGKIVAMNWGPWDQGGMVTEEVRRQFISRGVVLISPRDGAEAVIREIARETALECMPILGGGPWGDGASPAGAEAAARTLAAQAPV